MCSKLLTLYLIRLVPIYVVADERAILRLLKKVPNLDDVLINFDMATAVNGSNFNGAMRLSVGGYYDESTRTLSLRPYG
jgi:hypothetical protein